MERMIDAAKYIIDRYQEQTGILIDEMKLHKLLYFAQREAFALTGEPLFEGDFEGWFHGPVCREVRNAYIDGEFYADTEEVSEKCAYILNNVIVEYGHYESWYLSELSHKEISWKNARKGLKKNQRGSRLLSLEDIREDARKVRPYDHVWDMYYDEFEDIETEQAVNTD